MTAFHDVLGLIVRRQREATERGILNVWVIYNHPRDYPDSYVARRFEGEAPTTDIFAGELDAIRDAFIRSGLCRLGRHVKDDLKIVETWF